jgi:hypothetical protein
LSGNLCACNYEKQKVRLAPHLSQFLMSALPTFPMTGGFAISAMQQAQAYDTGFVPSLYQCLSLDSPELINLFRRDSLPVGNTTKLLVRFKPNEGINNWFDSNDS